MIRTRTRVAVVLCAAAVTLAFAATPAVGGHGPDAPGGPYRGHSTAAALHVDALTNESTRLVDLEVGVANAAVDSEGLRRILNEYRREIVPAELGDKHSRGHSTILEVGVAHAPDAENQVKPFVAEVSAPASDAVTDVVLNQSVGPVLHVDLLRNEAEANWNNDTCVIGEPISQGEQHTARANAVELGDNPDTGEDQGFDSPLVGLDADQAGPPRATTHGMARQHLFDGAGAGFGLQSLATSTLAPVTFLEGTANEFTLEFDGAAYLVASAEGVAGTAKVIFNVPLVSLIQNGTSRTILPGSPIDVRVPGTGDIVAQVQVGVLSDQDKAANGTSASGVANVVEVTILDVASQELRGATVALGHLEASALVPAGGIQCPIPVNKDANPNSVSTGDLFRTTITITNKFACPITNLSLTDEITVEDSALFEVISSSPNATDATGGSNLDEGTVEWANLGTLAPGKSTSVTVDLEAQGGAGRILDTAVASGTLTNCLAKPGSADADVSAMAAVKVPVSGVGTLEVPQSQVLGEQLLPRTGVGAIPIGGALVMAAFALAAATIRPRRVR